MGLVAPLALAQQMDGGEEEMGQPGAGAEPTRDPFALPSPAQGKAVTHPPQHQGCRRSHASSPHQCCTSRAPSPAPSPSSCCLRIVCSERISPLPHVTPTVTVDVTSDWDRKCSTPLQALPLSTSISMGEETPQPRSDLPLLRGRGFCFPSHCLPQASASPQSAASAASQGPSRCSHFPSRQLLHSKQPKLSLPPPQTLLGLPQSPEEAAPKYPSRLPLDFSSKQVQGLFERGPYWDGSKSARWFTGSLDSLGH